MKRLIVYGTGLIAEVAAFYFERDSAYQVAAFANAREFITEDAFAGRPVVPFEDVVATHSPAEYDLFVALGYKNTNQVRQARYAEAKAKGYDLATYVSSRATYYGTPVGDNCFILEDNVIQPFVTIGNNVTLWSGNHIGHHTAVRDHCFISSHVVVSGSCEIGENCFLGVNSTLRDNITLGRFVVVAAGATVMKDCPERTLVLAPASSYKTIDRDII
jgi:sugar O-acyltransferase (sialic acid O-acetyltransferase NeuD family)